MFDLIIRNGRVADGLGSPLVEADVAVLGGRIAEISPSIPGPAGRVIDASGLVVSPGFIDIHSHTDELILANPIGESKTSQGVTTDVSGNCGGSAAPRLGETMNAEAKEYIERFRLDPKWSSLGEFLEIVDKVPIAMNFATFVGHGNLRAAVVGYDERQATLSEIAKMQELGAQSVRDGAVGMTTGLLYAPSCYGDLDEFVAIMSAIAPLGGIYASHMRNESDKLCEAVEETIEVGRRSGAGVEISHHKATDPPNWGKVNDSLAMIDAARTEGLSVNADQYPYQATSTGLSMFIPIWVHDGGSEPMTARMNDPKAAARAKAEMNAEWSRDSWQNVVITSAKTHRNKWTEGKSMAEISAKLKIEPADAVFQLLLEEELSIGMVRFCINEDDIRTVMRHPAVMIGSDASAKATTGLLSGGKPHPRAYGTFPRVLGYYSRDEKVLPLEEAIRKMTSMPADRLGFTDRGRLLPTAAADIVLFDPDRVRDAATFQEPHQRAIGIEYVIINGGVIYEKGDYTGVMTGKVLRHVS